MPTPATQYHPEFLGQNRRHKGVDGQGILLYIKQVFGKTAKTSPNGGPQTRRLTDTGIRSILNKSTTLRNVTFLKRVVTLAETGLTTSPRLRK